MKNRTLLPIITAALFTLTMPFYAVADEVSQTPELNYSLSNSVDPDPNACMDEMNAPEQSDRKGCVCVGQHSYKGCGDVYKINPLLCPPGIFIPSNLTRAQASLDFLITSSWAANPKLITDGCEKQAQQAPGIVPDKFNCVAIAAYYYGIGSDAIPDAYKDPKHRFNFLQHRTCLATDLKP